MTNRRTFLAHSGAVATLASLGSAARLTGQTPVAYSNDRSQQAFRTRLEAAGFQRQRPAAVHATNGDLQAYSNYLGSYSKGLPHNAMGEVDPGAFAALSTALETGRASDFASIPMGGTTKLTNPRAAFAYDLCGSDSHQSDIVAPPALASAQAAGEMTEVYWQALTRDVPFADFASSPVVAAAVDDLSKLSDFRGPKAGSRVTPATLFRGNTPGDTRGPFLSQFLARPIPFGATQIVQQYRVPISGTDYMTSPAEWLSIQNGVAPDRSFTFDSSPRYIRNGRDLAWFVRQDFSYQAYQSAALMLLSFGAPAMSPENYYRGNSVEAAFISFGPPCVLELVAAVATAALRAAWYQKWLLHLRLRPEAYAGLVHQVVSGAAKYPLHSDVLNSAGVSALKSANGSALLPMAYPEGSPTHPAYPAGHAAIAGACVTVLKAFFNESFLMPSPVVSAADGSALLTYEGPLTVGDELNKLAANISLGRDTAGVHYRSDGIEGLRLGEAVASSILHDVAMTYQEDFAGFSFTRFDGSTHNICPRCA